MRGPRGNPLGLIAGRQRLRGDLGKTLAWDAEGSARALCPEAEGALQISC